jgi:hypothetical protein
MTILTQASDIVPFTTETYGKSALDLFYRFLVV